jgi:hypothetical protein
MSLYSATITSGTIGGCTISAGSISGSGWSLSGDGVILPSSLQFGDYDLSVKEVTIRDMWWRPKGSTNYISALSTTTINYKNHSNQDVSATVVTGGT